MSGEARTGANFAIDTTNLKAGLQQANRLIRESESEFKAAAAGIEGDWTKSSKGVEARIKYLTDATDVQAKKVNALKDEYSRLIKDGLDPTSKQAVDLRTKINQEQAALSKNETELKKQKKALEEMGDESEEAAKETDDLADSTEKTGKGFSALKGAAAIGVAAIGAITAAAAAGIKELFALAESTREFREDTSRLSAAFEGAGFSAESAEKAYTKLYRAIGETDTAVEAAQQIALLADSEKQAAEWADLATGVVATFGDALKPETFFEAANETIKLGEATGAFTQMLEGTGVDVETFNAKLEACTTEQEKQAYMLEVSKKALGDAGKAYEETAGDILDAREATAKLEQAQADLGASIEPLNTMLTNFKTSILTDLSPALEQIITDMTAVAEGTDGATTDLAASINSLIEDVLASFVDFMPQAAEMATELILLIVETIIEQLPGIVEAGIKIITTLIGSLADTIPGLIPTIVDAVILIAETLIDNIDEIIDAGIKLIEGLGDGLIKAIPRLLDKVPEIIERLFNALMDNLPRLLTAGVNLVVELANGLIKAIPQLLAKLPTIISQIVKGLLTEGVPALIQAGADLLSGLFEGMLNPSVIWENIKKVGGGIIDGIKNFFGIHSPSTVMRDEVGQFMGEGAAIGFGEGFEDKIRGVDRAIVRSLQDIAPAPGGSGGGQAATAGGVVVNQYNTYTNARGSSYEIYKTRKATEAAIRLAVANGGVV